MTERRRFILATDIHVYFCDPHPPWQRGTNENSNGLMRQYFPRGIGLEDVSHAMLDAVARQLNERPCTLGYETQAERQRKTVASIGRTQDPKRTSRITCLNPERELFDQLVQRDRVFADANT